MYTSISNDLATLMSNSNGLSFLSAIKENGTAKSCIIRDLKISMGGNGAEYITMGTAFCASAELTLYGADFPMRGHEYEICIGMDVDGTPEYVPMGMFTAEKPVLDGENTKVTLYDRMKKTEKAYFSSLPFPAGIDDIVEEICEQCGIPYVSFSSNLSIQDKPEGYTCREMISYIAQLLGSFAIINRSGQLEFKWYSGQACRTLSTSQYWDPFDRSENDYAIHRIAVVVGKEDGQDGQSRDKILVASGSTGAKGIVFENPFYTQETLNSVFTLRKNFTFRPGTVKALGDPRLDPGDVVTISAMDGNTYLVPVMTIDFEYDGGLSMKIGAVGEEEQKDDFSVKGPNTQAVERLATQLVLANRILANKIDAAEVSAYYATITSLNATNAEIENLQAVVGDFESIRTETLTSVSAFIGYLDAELLDAGHGRITILESDLSSIIHLLANNAQATSVSAIQITADNAVFDTELLKTLIAENISAQELKAGSIVTNQHSIVSEDGSLSLTGNVLQFRDENDAVRVQIGKDGQGNFSYALFDENGNPLWYENGVTADAIPDGLIVDDMVANNANISAEKLNIQSLIGAVNEEGGLRASSVIFDEDGQSLEVHFAKLKVGGKNLMIGTRIPDFEEPANAPADWEPAPLPHLIGQTVDTVTSPGDITNAQHGFRITNAASVCTEIRFGLSEDAGIFILDVSVLDGDDLIEAMQGMHGLIPGETYTLSFNSAWKLLSNYSGDTTHTIRAKFKTDVNNSYVDFGDIEPGDEQEGRCVFTFEIPEEATGGFLQIYCTDGDSTHYDEGDYIELSDLMFELASKDSNWSPAPEEIDNALDTIDTRVSITNGRIDALITQVEGDESDLASLTLTVGGLEQQYSSISSTISDYAVYKQNVNEALTRISQAETDITGVVQRVQTAEQKITPAAITTVVREGGFSGVNLLALKDLAAINGGVKTVSAYTVTVESTTELGGIKIPETVFKPNTVYTLSFSFKKKSGTMNSITVNGGSGSGSILKVIYRSASGAYNETTYEEGTTSSHTASLADNTIVRSLEIVYKTASTPSVVNIRANSGSTTAVTLEYWDIQLECGEAATAWKPNYADTDAYTESRIEQSADTIRMKAATIVWTATNSSMDSTGKLTCSNADISGKVTASSGKIGGFNITSSANTGTSANGGHCYTDSLYVHTSDNTYEYEAGMKGQTNSATTLMFYVRRIAIGASWASPTNLFYVNNSGKLYAQNADITGKITASSGNIGNVKIAANGIYSRSSTTGVTTALKNDGTFSIFKETTDSRVVDPDTGELILPSYSTTKTILKASVSGLTTHNIGCDKLLVQYEPDWTDDPTSLVEVDKYFEVTPTNVITYKRLLAKDDIKLDEDGVEIIFGTDANGARLLRKNGAIGMGKIGTSSYARNVVCDEYDTMRLYSSSSKRYKNPTGYVTDEDALRLLDLPVVKFVYKPGYLVENDENNGRVMAGLFAEDVAELFPDAVFHYDGQVENYADRQLLVRLIKLCQIQQREIDELKKGVA